MALQFTGTSSQYADVASSPVSSAPLTISAWAKSTGTSGTIATLGYSGGPSQVSLVFDGSRRLFTDVIGSTGTEVQTGVGTAVPSGVWTHVGTVVASATSITSYSGGTPSTTATTNFTGLSALNHLSIGAQWSWGAAASYLTGSVAEVGIWNVALSAAEMASLASGARPISIRPESLVFYSHLDGTATPSYDQIAARNLAWNATPVRDATNPNLGSWLNFVSIAAPRNAGTAHTVDPSSSSGVLAGVPFTPTAGRFLTANAEGSVTSTTPTGWTLPTNGSSINNTGLYVWTKTAAGADTLSTTHNGTNYPGIFTFYEFPAGSTFGGAATLATGGATSTAANPTLSGLSGRNVVFGMAATASTATTAGITGAWSTGNIEAVDSETVRTGSPTTDGYWFGLAYQDEYIATSYTPTPTISFTTGSVSSERLTWAVKLPFVALQPTTAPQKSTKSVQSGSPGTVINDTGVVVDAGSNLCLIAAFGGEGAGTSQGSPWVASCAYGGVPLTRLAEIRHNSWSWTEIWYLLAPTVGSATLSYQLANADDILTLTTFVGQGVDQVTPFRTTQSEGGASTASVAAASLIVPGVTAADLVFDVLDADNSGHTFVSGPDQTTQSLQEYSGVTTASVSTQPGSAGGIMSWTWTNAASMSHLATAFVPVSLAGPVVIPDIIMPMMIVY